MSTPCGEKTPDTREATYQAAGYEVIAEGGEWTDETYDAWARLFLAAARRRAQAERRADG